MGNKIWRELRTPSCIQELARDSDKTAVMPYIHGVSHRLKKVVGRAGVRLVFSAPNKLSKMCARVNDGSPSRRDCDINHVRPFTKCRAGVVYSFPLDCDRQYVGQTGRCLNVRLMEHASNVKAKSGGWLHSHVSSCKCTPIFDQCKVIKHYRDQRTRELLEAYTIYKGGDDCVSTPSVALSAKEIAFIEDEAK